MEKNKPVVIYISHDSHRQYDFVELLDDQFNFIPSCTVKNGLKHLDNFKGNPVVILIDEECGMENNNFFFSSIKKCFL